MIIVKDFMKGKKQNQQVVLIYKWLLSRLMNGQVTLRQAQEPAQEDELSMVVKKGESYGK